MNPTDLASILSSVGNGSGASLMQGSQRGRVLPGSSNQPATSLLDAFGQQTPDSRPNTAPAATRTTGTGGATAAAATATGGTTSTSSTRPTGPSSKPRNGGTSSSPSTAAASASGSSSGTSGGPKGGPIQMSALSNILANLSGGNPSQGASGSAAAKPPIDLYDIMTTEVNFSTYTKESFEYIFFFL